MTGKKCYLGVAVACILMAIVISSCAGASGMSRVECPQAYHGAGIRN